MYEIIKNVIKSGRYELADMLRKIDTIWLQGSIADEEKDELIQLAQENADPANSYAPLQNQIDTLFANYKELAQEILALKNGGTLTEEPSEEYPQYVQPTGADNAYYNGDKMTYTDGNRYLCTAPEEFAVVWGPDVYPQGWQLVVD